MRARAPLTRASGSTAAACGSGNLGVDDDSGNAIALEAIRHVRADQFFMGVTGVHPEAGLTTGDMDDAATKRALAAQASETYVLASREKVGVASAFPVIERDRVAGIIVDPEVA